MLKFQPLNLRFVILVLRFSFIQKEVFMYNHQLDTFIVTAECGSFTKAAKKLYITPTAVLQQIRLLEEQCGFQVFDRSNHGVTLTVAGKSFYEDAKSLIAFSKNALTRARLLARSSETTVRIFASVMLKCRFLPELCAKAGKLQPDLRFEIPAWDGTAIDQSDDFQNAVTHDIAEGIFCTILWKDKFSFMELFRTPICCAVSRNHPLANRSELSLKDLAKETLIMPGKGASIELDNFREQLLSICPDISILDSSGYGMETFAECEMKGYVLITQPVYSDIHSNLLTIPLDTDITLPYGLIYSKTPTTAAKRFLRIVQEMKDKGELEFL